MSSRQRLIDWSANSTQYFSYDQHDKSFTIETREDVEPLIQVAHEMSSLQPSNEFRHSAIIPKFVLDQSLRERWGPKDWKKWANDHANKPFRTWPGNL